MGTQKTISKEELMWDLVKEATGAQSIWELKQIATGSANLNGGFIYKMEIELRGSEKGLKMIVTKQGLK